MTNEIHPAQSELTNSSPSPKLEVRNIYMPDPNPESSSTAPVLERPRPAPRPKNNVREIVRRFRETGEKPPGIGGGAPMSASSKDIKEDVKRAASMINPDRFDDSQIKAMANAIKRGDRLSHGTLQDFRDIAKARVSGDVNVDPEQATAFTQFVDNLIHVVDVSEGKAFRELPEETRAKYYVTEYMPNVKEKKQKLDEKAADGIITPEEEIARRDYEEIIENFPAQQEERLIELVALLPVGGGQIDESTIHLIAENDKALGYFINRLVSSPLDFEMGDYTLGFYGQNNLDSLKNYLKSKADKGDTDAMEDYHKLLYTSGAIQLFHTMNKLIVTGNLDGFTRGAEAIQPDQLQLMQGVLGSSLAMRLLDQEYELLLSRDGWINNDNYGKMMGFVIKDVEGKGRIVDHHEGSVFQKFKNEVSAAKQLLEGAELAYSEGLSRGVSGVALDELATKVSEARSSELVNMADWEISWAYNVGKILHNLSLRPAEYISQGRNPEGSEQYASFPQEGMARIMNWMNEMMLRFDVASVRGGTWLTNRVKKIYEAQRKEDGYDDVNISEIQGKELNWFELPGIFEVSGPMSSWRQTLMILRQIPYDETVLARLNVSKVIRPEGEALSLGHLVDTKLIKFTEKGKEIGFDDLSDKQKANYFRTVFLEKYRDPDSGEVKMRLRTDINTALGVLLKNSSLAPDADPEARHKYKEFEAVKQEIRQAIWRRVAEDNPLAIVPYLNGLKYKGEKDAIKIIGKGGRAEQLGVNYEEFSQKLFRLNEIRMQKLRREKTYDNPDKGYVSLQDLIREQIAGGKLEWSGVEQQLLDYIKEQGIRAAPEFANVRFNFNPFMNDVLFEKIVYGQAGAEFYRRRAAGDLGSMFKALQGFIALAGNPGSYEVEKYLEHIHAIVEGLGSPLGTEAGQRKALPVYEAMQEFTARGENNFEHVHIGPLKIDLEHEHKTLGKTVNHRVVKTLRKWAPVHALLNSSNRPNSWAQQFTGSMTAHAFNTAQQDKVLHEAAHMGTLNHEQVKKLRKKLFGMFRFKFFFWLLADFLPLFAIGTGVDITKKPFTEGDVFK